MSNTALIEALIVSLLFYAGFDKTFDADYSKGNGTAIVEPDRYPPQLTVKNGGQFGEAVEFHYDKLDLDTVWTKDTVRYEATENFPHDSKSAFDGSVGMWVMIDMESLLTRELIWLDPLHLLSKDMQESRDAGKIWMDFVTKELDGSPLFRFGATLPKSERKKPDNGGEGHVITVPGIDFKDGEWHHIIGSWKSLNASDDSGIITLYIDGMKADEIQGVSHPLSWAIDRWEMRLGIGFAGKIDEFFTSNTYITVDTAKALYSADKPLSSYIK